MVYIRDIIDEAGLESYVTNDTVTLTGDKLTDSNSFIMA